MAEEAKEKPIVDEKSEGLKVKKKRGRPRKLVGSQEPIKVNLTKEENAVQEQETNDSNAIVEQPKNEVNSEKVVEEVQEPVADEKPVQEQDEQQEQAVTPLVEITDEEKKEESPVETQVETVKEVVVEKELPENLNKLVKFMEETGGSLEDYVRINADYTNVDEDVLLREYYKTTKPHLNSEEINFILEDNFSWDEEEEEERAVKKKKLAYKEEIAKARKFLEDTKNKYYDEIKLRPSVTQEQKKAVDFFNRYNEEQERANTLHSDFMKHTEKLFTNFKGFDFNLSDKKFRYAVNNSDEVKNNQSKITNFTRKFLNKDGTIKDAAGYHRALYVANNSDAFANHFYEQGKADAIRDLNAKSKNINIQNHNSGDDNIFVGGFKVKAINGESSSRLKIKKRTKIN